MAVHVVGRALTFSGIAVFLLTSSAIAGQSSQQTAPLKSSSECTMSPAEFEQLPCNTRAQLCVAPPRLLGAFHIASVNRAYRCAREAAANSPAPGVPGSVPTPHGVAAVSTPTTLSNFASALNKALSRLEAPPPRLPAMVAPTSPGWTAAATTFQPLDLSGGSNPGVDQSVDTILNAGAQSAPARRIAFEHEMPRPDRPDHGFLKRIWGELRSANGQHDLFINIDDMDRSWRTTDQCVTLDMQFQLTLAVESGGAVSHTFPVIDVPVTASDGKTAVRVPLSLGQPGQPVDVQVNRVVARPCGDPPTTTPERSCPTSTEEQLEFLRLRGQLHRQVGLLTIKWGEMHEYLLSLRAQVNALDTVANRIEVRTRISSLLSILQDLVPSEELVKLGASAIVAGVSYVHKVYGDLVSEEDAVADSIVEILKGITEFSKRHLSNGLTIVQILKNELDLSETQSTFRDVIQKLNSEVAGYMTKMVLIDRRIQDTKVKLAELEGQCR